MKRIWDNILERFGQDVVLCGKEGNIPLRAILQPILEQKQVQELPSPLGLERQERFRYMGPAEHPLDLDTLVKWNGRSCRVQSAHLVGEGVCPHWWAMLRPGEEGMP